MFGTISFPFWTLGGNNFGGFTFFGWSRFRWECVPGVVLIRVGRVSFFLQPDGPINHLVGKGTLQEMDRER